MTDYAFRWMEPREVVRLFEIDRSEHVRTGYRVDGGELISMEVRWNIPTFTAEGEGDHSMAHQIDFCRGHLDAGGKLIGAFDREKLVGVGLLRPKVRDHMAQLAYLHVSNGYRREGIASRLMEEMIHEVSQGGAERIYVTSTPTHSAVGFYQSHGFRLANTPLPELFDLEPEDIHMIKQL